MEIDQLLEEAQAYLPPDRLVLVKEAYDFAVKAHQGQMRLSGEPVVQHTLETALILAKLRLDANSLVVALLHDVLEDCDVALAEIEGAFGLEVAKLVDGITKLRSVAWTGGVEQEARRAESLRKMLVAMAEDIRVIFIKLADRLHNMRTLVALPAQRRQRFAKETLEIYAPLAHRLGIWEMKAELEDLCFLHLQPSAYRKLDRLVSKRITEQEALIDRATEMLKSELAKANLSTEVNGRRKNLYNIYRKMEKYHQQGKGLGDIHDILALRVLVNEVGECYHALGVIHSLWHPLSSEFDDYIANPKENHYQSLHTTVMCFGIVPLEIQVRTYEMHHAAEYGVTAHWLYKEGMKPDAQFERRISWLRQLLEWHKEIGGTVDFLESVKTDLFNDQVFVYTPKGEIRDLPSGSTPIDFAYSIHTELGHRCVGARINGVLVPLCRQLRNGDTIEIIVTKGKKGPSRDWLNSNVGYVTSSSAKAKIRQWFKKQERGENVERGRESLEKEFRRLGLSLGNRQDIAAKYGYESLDDFYAAIGYGDVNASRITQSLVSEQESPIIPEITTIPSRSGTGIKVLGVGELLTVLGRCCNPLPGDEIIGYVTRGRGVTVHRTDCPNLAHMKDEERLVSVSWGAEFDQYPVRVCIEAWDKVGLLRDISGVVAEEKVNIAGVSTVKHKGDTMSIWLTVETKGVLQLSRLLNKLEGVDGVLSATRAVESHAPDAVQLHGQIVG